MPADRPLSTEQPSGKQPPATATGPAPAAGGSRRSLAAAAAGHPGGHSARVEGGDTGRGPSGGEQDGREQSARDPKRRDVAPPLRAGRRWVPPLAAYLTALIGIIDIAS